MNIIRPGISSSVPVVTGTCDRCGCVATYAIDEPGVVRNASREDHRAWYPTNYTADCPTEGCRGRMSGYLQPAVQPTLMQRMFG